MKKISLLVLFGLFFLSCNAKFYPLITKYPRSYSIQIDKPYDQVWINLLSYMGAKKYIGDTIDKGKGIILLSRMNYTKLYSFEWSDGTPFKPNMYFMVGKFSSEEWNSNSVEGPFRIYINWRITVTSENSKTTVTIQHEINYFNFKRIVVRPEKGRVELDRGILESTGKFEKEFLEQIR